MTTTPLPPDPAAVFPSDIHRRVLGFMSLPGEEPFTSEDLLQRIMLNDPWSASFVPELAALKELLGELEESGYCAEESFDKVVRDERGKPVLDGEGNEEHESAEGWVQTTEGHAVITGPIAHEPPPMEGPRLAAATKSNEEMAEAEVKLEEDARQKRVKEMKAQIEEVESEVA